MCINRRRETDASVVFPNPFRLPIAIRIHEYRARWPISSPRSPLIFFGFFLLHSVAVHDPARSPDTRRVKRDRRTDASRKSRFGFARPETACPRIRDRGTPGGPYVNRFSAIARVRIVGDRDAGTKRVLRVNREQHIRNVETWPEIDERTRRAVHRRRRGIRGISTFSIRAKGRVF